MCHSCVSSSPGLFPRKRESRQCTSPNFLDSRFRGNDTPSPASLRFQRPLDGQGRCENSGFPLRGRERHVMGGVAKIAAASFG